MFGKVLEAKKKKRWDQSNATSSKTVSAGKLLWNKRNKSYSYWNIIDFGVESHAETH